MEDFLRKIFDFSKFEKIKELDELITQTKEKYQEVPILSEEDLSLIAAAGENVKDKYELPEDDNDLFWK